MGTEGYMYSKTVQNIYKNILQLPIPVNQVITDVIKFSQLGEVEVTAKNQVIRLPNYDEN